MRVRDPGEKLTARENAPRRRAIAPFLAAVRTWRHLLFRGALLSGFVHASLIGFMLFGLPIFLFNFANESSESADPSLHVVLVSQEQARSLPSPESKDASATKDATPTERDARAGAQFLADDPADRSQSTERAEVPTTLNDSPSDEGPSDAVDKATKATDETRRADAQRPQPEIEPDTNRAPVAPQPHAAPQNPVEPKPAVNTTPTSPSPQAATPPFQAATPPSSPPAAQAAANPALAQTPERITPAPSLTPPITRSPTPPPLPTVPTSPTASPSAPIAPSEQSVDKPLPRPRTPAEVVERLGLALPRVAQIRSELQAARDRKPGESVPAPETSQSIERLEEFAQQGYGHAQFALAEMRLTGEGQPRDVPKGIDLATRAALNGYLPAQILLGAMAADGSVASRDLGEAHAWWTLAAANGSRAAAEAVKALEPMMEVRDVVKSRQRQAELRQMSVMLTPQTGRKLTPQQAGDKLREAAALGDLETVSVMLAQGADADSSDEDGRTAMIEAAWRGYTNIVNTLIQQGADLGQTDASGKSPLVWAAINGHAAVARLLLDAGQNPDLQDKDGINALMRAAWNDRPEVVREILEHKANPNLRDKNGMTAFDYAVRYGHPAIATLLRGATR